MSFIFRFGFWFLLGMKETTKPPHPQKDRPTDYAQDDSLGSAWAGHWQETQKDWWRILSIFLGNL